MTALETSLVDTWAAFLARVECFKQEEGKEAKLEEAKAARDDSNSMKATNFFDVYKHLVPTWILMRKEYVSYIDNIPDEIKDVSRAHFFRKFATCTQVDFEAKTEGMHTFIHLSFDKKSLGTRSGAKCILTFRDKRSETYFLKTNHSESTTGKRVL